MKKNKNFLKYIICTILSVLIFNIKGLDIKAAEDGYQFSCEYNSFTFQNNGKSYSVRADVYDNGVKLYIMNGTSKTEMTNGKYLPNSVSELSSYKLEYDNRTTYFYSGGKAHCPTLDINYDMLISNNTVNILFDAGKEQSGININSNSPTSEPKKLGASQEEKDDFDKNAEKVVLDCSENDGEYMYWYKPGSYNNNGEKGFILESQFGFNFKKYNNGRTEVAIKFGDSAPVTKTIENNSSSSFQLGGYSVTFKDLDSLTDCPERSELFFCWSGTGSSYYVTPNKDENCDNPEKAGEITDKQTALEAAGQYGIKYPSGIGGGSIDCDNLSEKLKDFLKNAFIIVKVVAILIAIAMSILDLMGSITKDKDVLSATIKKIITRIVLVIVVLLLPTLINIIGRLIVGKDVLCGIV